VGQQQARARAGIQLEALTHLDDGFVLDRSPIKPANSWFSLKRLEGPTAFAVWIVVCDRDDGAWSDGSNGLRDGTSRDSKEPVMAGKGAHAAEKSLLDATQTSEKLRPILHSAAVVNPAEMARVATVTVDPSLGVQSFTPLAAELVPCLKTPGPHHLQDVAGELGCVTLTPDAQKALSGRPVPERTFELAERGRYSLRVDPLRSPSGIVGVVVSLVDISVLACLECELSHMSKVVQDAVEPILIEDLDGTIVFVNEAAVSLFGWSCDELLSRSVELLIDESELSVVRQLRQACLRGEQVRDVETTCRRKSGELCTLMLTVLLIRDDAHRPVAIATMARDVTAQREAESLAREAVTRRDQLLAVLSHELRNPLGAVLNATFVLDQHCSLRDVCRSPCQVIQRQVQQMSRLLDDLLDVTRVTQGKIEIRAEPVDVREMIENVLPTVTSEIQDRQHELSVDIDSRPMTVYGDADRLQQVQVNLLTNAIKYTPPGGRIRLRAYPDDGDIVLSVSDTGEGIPANMLESVFELFIQARNTLDRADGGIGIGLTLVKQLVELHGGTVSAHSAGEGQGTEFVVRLPASGNDQADSPQRSTATAEKQTGRILIVEDNADSCDMLQMLLESYGYQVVGVADGHTALDALQNQQFDLALIDIGLPDIDGYEVARLIRQDARHESLRLVALTGYGADADRTAVELAGFEHHLVKPLYRADLDKVLPR
jgi:two-component system CheB/CheR fusion protein